MTGMLKVIEVLAESDKSWEDGRSREETTRQRS
jgi:hypothetical protein